MLSARSIRFARARVHTSTSWQGKTFPVQISQGKSQLLALLRNPKRSTRPNKNPSRNPIQNRNRFYLIIESSQYARPISKNQRTDISMFPAETGIARCDPAPDVATKTGEGSRNPIGSVSWGAAAVWPSLSHPLAASSSYQSSRPLA